MPRLIQVIQLEETWDDDPNHRVMYYYSLDGELLAIGPDLHEECGDVCNDCIQKKLESN
jgi:hypothetical protein